MRVYLLAKSAVGHCLSAVLLLLTTILVETLVRILENIIFLPIEGAKILQRNKISIARIEAKLWKRCMDKFCKCIFSVYIFASLKCLITSKY